MPQRDFEPAAYRDGFDWLGPDYMRNAGVRDGGKKILPASGFPLREEEGRKSCTAAGRRWSDHLARALPAGFTAQRNCYN
jgi:hypothetical protein